MARRSKKVDQVVEEAPKPRLYSPPACSACTNLRPANTNYSEVYCTNRTDNAVYRYCRCRFCGNRFKDVTIK